MENLAEFQAPLLEWESGYDLGIARIDAEHRQLIVTANHAMARFLAGDPQAVIDAAFASLVDAARQHFAYEESLMDEHRYPQVRQHAAAHERELAQMRDFAAGLKAGAVEASDALTSLADWLLVHILQSDVGLAEMLGSTGVPAPRSN